MENPDALAARFERHRPRLRSMAWRMLGSPTDADDAVQETWLRLSRADTGGIDNLDGWLTTVVGRVCLDMLRGRARRREQVPDRETDARVPDPIVIADDGNTPEEEALVADAVGVALMVVLDTLTPAERLAFVLHDIFGLSFDEIAPIVERSPVAARKLASRARLRVRGAEPSPAADLPRQRAVVAAFLAAAREGDFDALIAVLHPDVVLRADYGAVPPVAGRVARGATGVADEATLFSRLSGPGLIARPALVNGAAGRVVYRHGVPYSVMGFGFAGGRIAAIDILVDPARLRRLDLPPFDG